MRKVVVFFVFMLALLVNITVARAESFDIKVTDAKIIEKGGTVIAKDPVISGNDITSEISFNQKDDYVIYDFEISNNVSDKYKIESIVDNNSSNNLEITYDYSKDYFTGKTNVKVKMLYKENIDKNSTIDLSDLTLKITLEKEDGSQSEIIINNPTTGDNIIKYIMFFGLSILALVLIAIKFKPKRIKLGLVVLGVSLLVLPAIIFATLKYEIKVRFTNVEINGIYDTYEIPIDPDNGDEAEVKTIKYGQKLGELPSAPSKEGYNFDKWVDQNGNAVTEETVVTAQLEISAQYNAIEYSIVYELNGGDVTTNPDKYTIEDEITLNKPTKNGYTFIGWTGSNGTTAKENVTISNSTGDLSYVANYEANELDFNGNDTIGEIYSDAAQTFTIEAASNGAGEYTYEITDGNDNNYFEIDGRTITVKANTPAGEYTIKVKAKDTETQAEKEATFKITISKKASEKVTNLSVNSNGEVTFTNGSDSDGYLISVDGVNYTPVLPGDETTTYDYLNEITSETGTRTIYVKSTNSDDENYEESEPVSVNVTVYSLSINVNNDDYGTVSESSVNVISGATYTTNNDTLTLSDSREITTSKKDENGYVTTFAGWSSESGTISQDTTITANYTREIKNNTLTINSMGGTIEETEGWTIEDETATTVIPAGAEIDTIPTVTLQGYILAGWNTEEDGSGDDVTEETVITEDTIIYAQWIEAQATFINGTNFNYKIKRLSGSSNSYYYPNHNIKSFERSTTKPDISTMTDANLLSTSNSTAPIYGWFDNGTIYYWTEDLNPSLNNDSSLMFYYLNGITNIDLTSIDTSNVTNMNSMFNNCSSLTSLDLGDNFDTSNVTYMDSMFYNCSSLTSLDLGDNFDTSNVTTMYTMFAQCSSLTSLDLGDKFDTSNVTSMYAMFAQCSSLTSLDLGDKFDTSNVTNMSYMFNNCSSLTSLDLGDKFNPIKIGSLSGFFSGLTNLESLNLGDNFDTSNITYMESMFNGCSSLTSLDLGEKFDTSNVINMDFMFNNCSSLTSLDLGEKFDTSNVTSMSYMFNNCSSLTSLDVSSFITNKVRFMQYMFANCSNLQTIYASNHFVIDYDEVDLYYFNNMFTGDTKLVGGAGTTYSSSYINSSRAKIDRGYYNPGYFTAGLEEVELKFNPAGGTVNIESKMVDKGLSVGSLPVAEKDGLDFAGWYTDVVDGTPVDEDYVIDKDTTVYAHWVQSDLITHIDKNNNDIIDKGDEMRIGAEEFYVISGGYEVTLLTKYNLDVNNRQSKRGYIKTSYTDSIYWDNYETASSTSTSTSDVCDNSYDNSVDDFDLVKYYNSDDYNGYYVYRTRDNDDTYNNLYDTINNYKSHLIDDKGINVEDVRLMSLDDIGGTSCNYDNCPEYLKEQNFWLGTTAAYFGSDSYYVGDCDSYHYRYYLNNEDYVYAISKENGLSYEYYGHSNYYGIRPVVIIKEEDLVESHTVSFETNGAGSINDISVLHGHTIGTMPNSPTKDNMKFVGWYEDPNFVTKFTKNKHITKDITLYAKYVDWCKTFSTDSWSTIKTNIDADPSYYGYGCEKNISIDMDDNGTPETYTVRIANTSTSNTCITNENSSQTACGVVIEFVTPVAIKMYNSSTTMGGGWNDSELVTWLNSDFYNKLPNDVKSVIKPTYPIVSSYSKNINGTDTAKNKIYLLSRTEIYNYSADSLDYYKEADEYTNTYNSKKKKYNNSYVSWWLRDATSYGRSYYIGTNGYEYSDSPTYTYAVAPAFRIGTPSYFVNFDTDGGSSVTRQLVVSGGKATRPEEIPEKTMLEFDDWYTDETYETKFDFENTEITADTTIYAKYKTDGVCKSFLYDSWDTINANLASDLDYYAVGCEKTVKIDMDGDGILEKYHVRIANTSTPEVCSTEGYSQTACGVVIEFITPVAKRVINPTNTNVGGWKESQLVTWLNSDFYNKLPSDLKNSIKATYPIVSGSGSGGVSDNITSDDTDKNKIYLLSTREVNVSYSYDNKKDITTDTRTLDYYIDADNATRIKSEMWWLRTSRSNGNRYFLAVRSNGVIDYDGANDTYAVTPAFRIGATS